MFYHNGDGCFEVCPVCLSVLNCIQVGCRESLRVLDLGCDPPRETLKALYQQGLAERQATTLSQKFDLLLGARHCLLSGMHQRLRKELYREGSACVRLPLPSHAARLSSKPVRQSVREFTAVGGQLAHLTKLRSFIRKPNIQRTTSMQHRRLPLATKKVHQQG